MAVLTRMATRQRNILVRVEKDLSSEAHVDSFAVECDALGTGVAAARFACPMIVLAETSQFFLYAIQVETALDKAGLSMERVNGIGPASSAGYPSIPFPA